MKPATFYGSTPRRFPSSRSQSGFSMASQSRLYQDWNVGTISTDSILRQQLVFMRNRARQLARDEDYMRSFLAAVRNNVIGPNGVVLQMDARNPDGETDDLANDAIEGAWDEFSKPATMSADGRYTPGFCANGETGRVQFGHLAMTTTARDGEFYYRVVRGFDNPWGFTVQPINPDYIDEEKNEVLRNGDQIRMGVQKNMWGQVTAYWLRTWNPGDVFSISTRMESKPVPASEIRRFYLPDDFELSRGYPWIHAGATRLKMLGGYEESALEASRGAACKNKVWERPVDANGDFRGESKDADGNWLDNMEPGVTEIGPIGWKLNVVDPKYPHTEHKGFISATLMGIAAGLNISAMTLTGDLSNANYSSMRAGLLPERDMWRVIQGLWICQVEQPIFMEWLRMSLLRGAIKMPNGSALPAVKFEKFAKPMFIGRRWAWVDPEKDQRANKLALDEMLTTRTAVVAEQGGDFEDVLRARAREQKLFAKYGLEEPLPDNAPQAAPADPNAAPVDGSEQLRSEMETFGIGVRAGAITPTEPDEDHFRERAGLPPVPAEAKKAWTDDKGVRRPITLVPPGGSKPSVGQPEPPPEDGDDADATRSRTPAVTVSKRAGEAQPITLSLPAPPPVTLNVEVKRPTHGWKFKRDANGVVTGAEPMEEK